MTAKEARELVPQNIPKDYDEIMGGIKLMAERGHYFYHAAMSEETKLKLIEDGFLVSTAIYNNEYKISW